MRRITIIICCCIYTLTALSQENNVWLTYYAYIDTAELAIVDSSYAAALVNYQKAFQLVNNPYPEDYHNALLCAIQVNDLYSAIDYAKSLVKNGTTLKELEENKYYKPLMKSNQWITFLSSYPLIRKDFINNKNEKLESLMDQILSSDQYYAQKRTVEPAYEDSIFYVVYDNVKKILDYSVVNGYPYRVSYGVALIHFYQLQYRFNDDRFFGSIKRQELIKKGYDYNSINLDSIQTDMVLQGKFNPKYLYWAQPKLMLQVDDTMAMINYSDSIIHRLDSLRKTVGLGSMALYIKKGLYQLKINGFRNRYKGEKMEDYLNSSHISDGNFDICMHPALSMFFIEGENKNNKYFNKKMKTMLDPDERKKFKDYLFFKEIPRKKLKNNRETKIIKIN